MSKALSPRRSERLLLLRPADHDLPDLCRMHRDERVMATLGGVRTDAWTAELLASIDAHWREHGWGLWIAREPGSGELVGRGGLRQIRVGGRPEVEIAYALRAEFWGRGLATELARESARVAFEEIGRRDLVCLTLPHNRASRSVMEKTGFGFERDVEYGGLPHVLYRLTAADWRERADTVGLLSRRR